MSMTEIRLGHVEAHEKVTARFFYQPKGESGYISLGSIREFVDATTKTLVTRARAEKGARFVDDEQADLIHESFTFMCDELDANGEKLLRLARQNSNATQGVAEGQTATIESVKANRWYPIGSYMIANVAVNASVSGSCEEGTDYELDAENGMIRVIPEAGISDGENLVLTFDRPALEFESFDSQYEPHMHADFILELFNQSTGLFLRRGTGACKLNVTEFPSHTGEFGTFRVKMTPTGPIAWIKRGEATSIATAAEASEAAGMSSSSSSSSSATSSHSSSSSST